MKFSIFVAFVALAFSSCASLETVPASERTMDALVYDIPNVSKNQIFDSAKLWIAENFRSAKNVIDLEDREGGIIIAKGIITTTSMMFTDVPIDFSLRIDIKDQKIRLQFSIIGVSAGSQYGSDHGTNKQSVENSKYKLKELANDLFKYVTNNSQSTW